MPHKVASNRGKKAKDLPTKELSAKKTERIKGGKRTVVVIVPPKEIPSK